MNTSIHSAGNTRGKGRFALALIGVALLLTVADAVLVGSHWSWTPTLSQLMTTMVAGLAFFAVMLRRRNSAGEARQIWMLLALALLLQMLSRMCLTAAGIFASFSHILQIEGALLSGLYMAPLMYMIARTFSRDMTRMVHVLDSLMVLFMAILLAALVYYVDTTPQHIMVAHIGQLVFLSDAVNYSLAILVTFRLFGGVTGMRRHAYLVTAVFLWMHVAGVSGINRFGVGASPWVIKALFDAAFVAAMITALAPAPHWLRRRTPAQHTSMVIDGFAPIVLTITVLALGIGVSRLNFGVGMMVSVMSVLFYGLRMAYIQSRDRDRQRMVTLSNQRLQEQLGTDPLTNIANRITLDVRLPGMLSTSRTSNSSFSVLMIDIDFFKQYNDHFGHLAGDRCLVEVVGSLRRGLLRAGDLLARYGGEEFVVVLPDTSERAAKMVADRLVMMVSACNIPHPHSPYKRVTISAGVATCDHRFAGEATDLLEAADRALYRAKNGGRNCTVSAGESQLDWSDMPNNPGGSNIVRL